MSEQEKKHTPGPWEVEHTRPVQVWAGSKDTSPIICTMSGLELPEDLENARLIAAAPDLLAACEAIVERNDLDHMISDPSDREFGAIIDAIAKAKGVSP